MERSEQQRACKTAWGMVSDWQSEANPAQFALQNSLGILHSRGITIQKPVFEQNQYVVLAL